MSYAPKTSNLVRKAEKKRRLHLQKHGDVENAVYLELVENVKIAIKEEEKRDALTKARAEKSQRKEELSRITSDDILEESFQENALINAANAITNAVKEAADAEAVACRRALISQRRTVRTHINNFIKDQKKMKAAPKRPKKKKKSGPPEDVVSYMDAISARIETLETPESHPSVEIPLSDEML
jgi:hypothetical protein